MSLPADAPFVSRPVTSVAAGALAVGVHALFLLLLVIGVSWQTQHPAPVMVDVWDSLPQPSQKPQAPPKPVKQEVPPARPATREAPPSKPAVKEAPPSKLAVKEAPPPKPPDIALEKKKAEADRLKQLQAMQAAEEKALAEAARAEAEAMRKAREKELAEQKKRDLLRQLEEEELMQRMVDEDAAREARAATVAEAHAAEARAAAVRRQSELASMIGEYRDQISAKVRGNTRLPESLQGNPEVRCTVRLLPTGEVQSVRITRSSGNPMYDDAVVRAIQKSSPLPLPADREARAAFVPELSFVHRPKQ